MKRFERTNRHRVVHLPQELIGEILLRLPAKSLARFRSVSTAWLAISTDPSFILLHARRAPRSWLVRSFPRLKNPDLVFHNMLFSFPDDKTGRNFNHLSSHTPRSSCDGLVLFSRKYEELPTMQYVMNLLTGLRIDIPNPRIGDKHMFMLVLYFHRWTGEHRLLNFRRCEGGLDVEVLSLAGACSWRPVKAKAPSVSLSYSQGLVRMNDRLYWTCRTISEDHAILVFDFLKETSCLMELPSYGRKTFTSFATANPCLKFGLVDMEGTLCCWVVYRVDGSCSKDVKIDVWAVADGGEGWRNAYSLSLVDEGRWANLYPGKEFLLIDTCICISEKKLLFLFDNMFHTIFFFHWDLRSGEFWTEELLVVNNQLNFPALAYTETLVNVPCDAAALASGV